MDEFKEFEEPQHVRNDDGGDSNIVQGNDTYDSSEYGDSQNAEYEEPVLKPEKKKKSGGLKAAIITVAVVLILALGGGAVYYFVFYEKELTSADMKTVMDTGTFYEGITVSGVPIGNMTFSQAKEALAPAEQKMVEDDNLKLTIEDKNFDIKSSELEFAFNTDEVLQEAMMQGRQGSIIERNRDIEDIKTSGRQYDIEYTINTEIIKPKVEEIAKQASLEAQDAKIEVNKEGEEKFNFIDDVPGRAVNSDELYGLVEAALNDKRFGDIQIPSTPVEAKVKKADLAKLTTKFSTYSTSFAASPYNNPNRVFNIEKCAAAFNGYVLEPGERFDINKIVGPRTYDGGWKGAPGIVNGEYKTEAGGGVCQVSSTLFNVVLMAKLKIIEAQPHSWPLNYVPKGRDATISSYGPEFIFENNRDTPIYIFTDTDKNKMKLTIDFYGAAWDEDFDTIDLDTKLIKTLSPGKMEIIEDKTKPVGYSEQKKQRKEGSVWEVYRVYYKDGEEIRREKIWTATYRAFAGSKIVGTKPKETKPPTEKPDKTQKPEKTPKPTQDSGSDET